MRQPMVAGNWKMHGSSQKNQALLEGIVAGAAEVNAELAVMPPAVYLSQVGSILSGTNISWGAQTVSEHAEGAYTGEVSAAMLSDLGCTYVLVGQLWDHIL